MIWLKLAPYLGALVLLAGFGVWAHHRGYDSSQAQWQVRWDTRDQAEAKAVADANARNAAELAAHRAKDQEVVGELQTQLKTSHDTAVDLARQLRLAAAASRGIPLPSTGPAASGADGAGDRDWCDSRIESRTATVLEAAEACAAELTGWQRRGR